MLRKLVMSYLAIALFTVNAPDSVRKQPNPANVSYGQIHEEPQPMVEEGGFEIRDSIIEDNIAMDDYPKTPPKNRNVILPIEHMSQGNNTPYCVSTSVTMVMKSFDKELPPNPLEANFRTGRTANTTSDPGIDPDGLSYLLRSYGAKGEIHEFYDQDTAINGMTSYLDMGFPIIAFTRSGSHVAVVYGYEMVDGEISALYVTDPDDSVIKERISIWDWKGKWDLFSHPFASYGDKWQKAYIFASTQ